MRMAVLIILAFALLVLLIRFDDIRLRLLSAAVATSVIMVALTESLGAMHWLTGINLALGWTTVILMLAAVNLKLRRFHNIHWRRPVWQFDRLEMLIMAAIAGLALLLDIIAVVAAPNNWDSMAYHLPRVMQWIQNRSLAPFATPNLSQLYMAPGSEMGILNLMLLSSNHDTLVNLPQWFAMLGSALAASYLAGRLGGSRLSQIMAALIVMTTPMVELQSTTTQNDLMVTLWTMIFLVFAIQDLAKPSTSTAILAGCSLGLAMLTKPTAYLLIFVWLLTWVGLRLWKLRLRGLPALATAALCAILICAPYWWRNYQVFQHPLGPQSESREFYNQPISLKGATLNLIRNTGIHIILPSAMADSATNWLADGLKAREWDLNDPAFTYNDHLFRFPTFSVSEDRSGNFLLLLLISCLPIYLFVNRKKSATNFPFAYAILLTLTALLFAILLTWQAYQSRLMVGWFVMAAPLVGVMLGSGRRWLHWVSCAVLLAGILPYIWLNPTKQLWTDWNIFNLPRREVMMRREDMLVDYVQAQELLSRDRACHTVGLISEGYDWEYPLWALLRDSEWRLQTQPYEIRHILVQNVTASLEDPAFTPCAVLVTASNRPETILYHGSTYSPALQTPNIWVYLSEEP